MNYFGIDISKKTFDVANSKGNSYASFKFENSISGFKQLKMLLNKENDCCVMEASGPYYLNLANFLDANGFKVSLVNPLVIRRFSQMRMLRAKTDKKDAITIAEYAKKEEPTLWEPNNKVLEWLRQMQTHLSILKKQRTALRNQNEALEQNPLYNKDINESILNIIEQINIQIKKIEIKMNELAIKHYGTLLYRLESIAGIGRKTAISLIIITDGFKKFENSKQLSSFIGVCPRVFNSGTSIKGKGSICKMGMSHVRALLYMCSWAAKRKNKACIEMYERLIQKGKPERVIKIAIVNKLIKQAFSIAKNNTYFDENYSPKICI